MLVDWVTIIAQAVNFLILLYLLRRFLYGPISDAIEQRRLRIEGQLARAKAAEADARRREEQYRAQYEAFQAEEISLRRRAETEAKEWAAGLRRDAESEIDGLRRRWQDALRRDQEVFWHELGDQLTQEVYDTAEQVVADLAGAELQASIEQAFLEHLGHLAAAEQSKLQELVEATTHDSHQPAGVEVLMAREASSEYRDAVEVKVRDLFGTETSVSFVVRPTLLAGVELRGPGWKTGWTIRGYLDGLRQRADALLSSRVALAESGGEPAK